MTIVPILVRCPSNMGQQKDAQVAREIVIYSLTNWPKNKPCSTSLSHGLTMSSDKISTNAQIGQLRDQSRPAKWIFHDTRTKGVIDVQNCRKNSKLHFSSLLSKKATCFQLHNTELQTTCKNADAVFGWKFHQMIENKLNYFSPLHHLWNWFWT